MDGEVEKSLSGKTMTKNNKGPFHQILLMDIKFSFSI